MVALIPKQKEGKTAYEGTRIGNIRSQFGLEQLIHKSANITKVFLDRFSFCLLTKCGSGISVVQSFLHENSCHQIVLARFKVVYPPL